MKKIFFFAMAVCCAYVFPQNSKEPGVIFSEIMFAAPSGNNEFIELYNASPTARIDLKNFSIKYYNSSSDEIIDAGSGTILKPHSYAIVFEGDYDLTSGIYKNLVPDSALVLKIDDKAFGSSGMSNSTDRKIQLFNSSGNLIEQYTYSADNPKGISDEKIIIPGDTASAKWGNSLYNLGTPGYRNSISPLSFDPGIDFFSSGKQYVITGNPVELSVGMRNFGTNRADNYKVGIYRDGNNDSTAQAGELLVSYNGPPLEPGDSVTYHFTTSEFAEGGNLFIAKLESPDDENLLNNVSFLQITGIKINEVRGDIVINEIMYAPNSPAPEWVEIYNRSEKVISLAGYNISDNSDTLLVVQKSAHLNPGEYFVIASDSSIADYYNIPSGFTAGKLPVLNNSGDKVILLDSLYRVIDSLAYSPDWGGVDGRSAERISPGNESDDPGNWKTSKDYLKGTPGKINSVSRKDTDLSVAGIRFNPPDPVLGDEVSIAALVKNMGKNAANFSIILSMDTNNDSSADKKVDEISGLQLSPADSEFVTFNYKINGIRKFQNFIASVESPADQDTTNDKFYARITPGYRDKSLVINEIMYDPGKGEPEWVEVFNNSSDTMNLKNWDIINVAPSPRYYPLSGSDYLLSPGDYLVIAADTTFFMKHPSAPSKVIILNFGTLSNNFDGVEFTDPNGKLIDSVLYSSGWGGGNGVSIERISAPVNSNESANWASSMDASGSTPGMINSVSRKDFDIAIDRIIILPDPPLSGDDLTLSAGVKNPGKNDISFSLLLYKDINNDTKPDILLDSAYYSLLPSGDSVIISFDYTEKKFTSAAAYLVKAVNNMDQDTSNNCLYIKISPGYRHGSMELSEIMYDPPEGEPEWIELFNNSAREINLKNWHVINLFPEPSDYRVSINDFLLGTKELVVLAKDSTFYTAHPGFRGNIIISDFGTLNNSADGLIIVDNKGSTIDSINYLSAWGGGNGFSLERISYNNGTNISNNWRTSISPEGSTPGIINSAASIKSYTGKNLVVNELMFDPSPGNSEFIELFNTTDSVVNVGGWSLTDERGDAFPVSRVSRNVGPGDYFVLAADSAILKNYSISSSRLNIAKTSSPALSNSSGLLILKDATNRTIDSVKYSADWHNKNFTITKNKSLEKINPYLDGNNGLNWSTSADPAGATPGRKNSIFTRSTGGISAGVTISPNPFSPDNDGFEDFTVIHYRLPEKTAQVNVRIFDSRGRLVRTLENNFASGSEGSIIFDGLDDNSTPLRMGIYIVLIEAINTNSGASEKIKTVVVVARKL